jgi:hypothetical protein
MPGGLRPTSVKEKGPFGALFYWGVERLTPVLNDGTIAHRGYKPGGSPRDEEAAWLVLHRPCTYPNHKEKIR